MKILNLFAGPGGNRRLWNDPSDTITAVENNEAVASQYRQSYPGDNLFVTDAYRFVEKNYEKYDFIWASPMCNRNSRFALYHDQAMPDFRLYELIVFLDTHYHGLYCVENVVSWFRPLIEPLRRGRHYLWTNFWLPEFNVRGKKLEEFQKGDPRRQMVDQELGKYVLDAAKESVVGFPQHDGDWYQRDMAEVWS